MKKSILLTVGILTAFLLVLLSRPAIVFVFSKILWYTYQRIILFVHFERSVQ